MAARPAPRQAPSAAAVIRAAAVMDIALGLAIAIFGESVVPMGDFMPGIRLLWLVGGVVAVGGVGALVVASALTRRQRKATFGSVADSGPVKRS